MVTSKTDPKEPRAKGEWGPETKHRHTNPVFGGPSLGSKSPLLGWTREDHPLKGARLLSPAELGQPAWTRGPRQPRRGRKPPARAARVSITQLPLRAALGIAARHCTVPTKDLHSANQGPSLAKHLSTCTTPRAQVAARNDVSSRDLLAFMHGHRR